MSIDRTYDEKRNFIRMRIDSDALIRVGDTIHDALCIDLSSDGMQIKTETALENGQEIEVEILSQHSQLSSLKATAQILRVQVNDEGQYLLGLRILAMN